MSLIDRVSFGFSRRLPLMLQTEAAECGLACLAMISGYHGYATDLMSLRNRFSVSLKGATLGNLIQIAGQLNLNSRPLKLDLEHFKQLRLPCILHWNFNHFVVLDSIGAKRIVIHDPAEGKRSISWKEVSNSFTGVALEVWPGTQFEAKVERKPLKLRSLMGRVTGLGASCAQVLVLASALEIFALIAPLFLQWVVDNVLVSADRDLLTTLALGFALLMVIQQGISFLRAWVLLYMGTTLNLQWRANVFSHLIRLPVQYFEKRHLGDVVSRFNSIDLIQRTLTTSFFEAVLDGLMTVVTLVVMTLYSSILAAIASVAMISYAVLRWAWYRPLQEATEEQIVRSAKQQSHFLESVRGVKSIKLFQRQDERRTAWLTLLVDQINAEVRTQKMQMFYKLINGFLFGVENILVIWLGARLVLEGNFTTGVLMSFCAYKSQFDSRVSALIDKVFEVKMLRLQGERLADVVLAEPEVSGAVSSASDRNTLEPSITVRGLRYRYAEQEPFILDGVDFSIAPGESVAIVGPSGCGKTTLLNVILGLLHPTEGEILVGGRSLRQIGVEGLRNMVGTVMQDDVLFAGSISDNITFFDPQPDNARIIECATLAAIAADIAAMPMGFNTLVGDMGTVFSGGQKQRLLLARALYRRPRILILDEATSHLDVGNEQEVNRAIKALNITRIVIAHRPETIATANRALVLMGGKIVQDVTRAPSSSASTIAPHATA